MILCLEDAILNRTSPVLCSQELYKGAVVGLLSGLLLAAGGITSDAEACQRIFGTPVLEGDAWKHTCNLHHGIG